jgi:tungstate transport system ATP-binding protein
LRDDPVEKAAPEAVELDCGFSLVSYITRTSQEEMGIEPGARICGAFKATAVHVIPRP